MVCNYQIKVVEFYNILIGNVKKLVPNFFDKQRYVLHYENLQLYLRLGLKVKEIHHVLEFNQSQWQKPYVEFNTHTQKNRSRKIWRQRWKRVVEINDSTVYGNTVYIL